MAFDRIHPPDLWPSTIARLLYALVCSRPGGTPPRFADFLPRSMTAARPAPMGEAEILSAFGISPGQGKSP